MKVDLIRKLLCLMGSKDRRNALKLVVLIFFGMLLETLSIGLVIPVIAIFTNPEYLYRFPLVSSLFPVLNEQSRQMLIFFGLLGLIFVYVSKNVYLGLLALRQTKFCYSLQADLSQRLFSHYLQQPYVFHLQRNSAQLIRNTIIEVGYITGRVLMAGLQITAELLVIFGLGALLFITEPLGALIVSIFLCGTILIFRRFTRAYTIRSGEERQLHEGMRIQSLQQGFGAAKVIKLTGSEEFFEKKYELHNVASARASCNHSSLQQMPAFGLELIAVLGLVSLVVVLVLRGQEFESIVPTMGVFAAVAFRLMPSANRILLAAQNIRHGMPSIELVRNEFENLPPNLEPRERFISEFSGQIELEGVEFQYPGASVPTISGVSILIRRGESVGIIGPSGSGKSTLVNLILGLLKPAGGYISVDGVDIFSDVRAWQKQVGYVPQSIFLTDDSLLSNIAFGVARNQIDYEAVARAISAAQLDAFVAGLPSGLATKVGERGVRLSGGQIQRLGIARALYHDPAIIVLDEATSSLDEATEVEVMAAVNSLHGQKTTIIVAHRMSTVGNCDRLYRLNDGRISNEFRADKVLA